MKQFFQKNGVKIIYNGLLIIALIIAVGITWGSTKTDVEHNAGDILDNRGDIDILQAQSVDSQVDRAEIRRDLTHIIDLLERLVDK